MTAPAVDKRFFDTNVLVYLYAADAERKRARARILLESSTVEAQVVLSVQVLQEFFVTVTRLPGAPLTSSAAERELRRFCAYEIVRTDEALVLAGAVRARSSKISYWDALIVEAALRAGCRTLFTEDLRDGWRVDDTLQVVNPFAP